MNKQEAIHFLSAALTFANKGEDSSDIDGTVIKSMGELLRILEGGYGELTLVGHHPSYGDIYISVCLGLDVTYKTVSPYEANFKAMEAVYALIP